MVHTSIYNEIQHSIGQVLYSRCHLYFNLIFASFKAVSVYARSHVAPTKARLFRIAARKVLFIRARRTASTVPCSLSASIRITSLFSNAFIFRFLIIQHPAERHSLLRPCGPLQRFLRHIRISYRHRCDLCREPSLRFRLRHVREPC